MNPGAVGSNPAADTNFANTLISGRIAQCVRFDVARRYRSSVTLRDIRATVPTMANLLKRGATYFVRLTIPRDRWADVGRAMGAAGGLKREVVRTLQTGDFREA